MKQGCCADFKAASILIPRTKQALNGGCSAWRFLGITLLGKLLGTDTLRLLALGTDIVRYHREKGISYYRLTPVPGPQTRHLGHCTELWETAKEYGHRR